MLPHAAPREPEPSRRTPSGAIAAVLVVVAACAGTFEQGKSCACSDEPHAAATPPESAQLAPEALVAPVVQPAEDVPPAGVVPPDFSDPAWTRVPSRAGQYLVCWRTGTGKVPRNEDFELEVWVLRDGAPVRGAELAVSAWMPDHGHGMLRLPRTEPRADGGFRVEGMLLHMRGLWQLRFDVVEGALSESAECSLEL